MNKHPFNRNIVIPSCLSLVLVGLVGLSTAQTEQATEPDTVWDQIQAWYQYAKETGEQVPGDVVEWAKSDIKSMGDWEYKVFSISSDSPDHIQAELNRLGAERWDCMWIHPSGETTRYYMKRPVRSYLQHVPLSAILRLVPGVATDGDSN